MFYDTSVLWNTQHIVLNPPWGETLSFIPATVADGGGLANPYAAYPGGNPFPTPLIPPPDFAFPVGGAYVFQDQHIKPTNVQQWNLAIQKQVGANWLFSATYMGNKTTHLWLGQLGLQRVSAAVRDDGILRSTIPAGSEQSGAASDAALDDVQRQQIDGYADSSG